MRQHFPKWSIENPVWVPFEGEEMPILKDAEGWLSMSYGDYMTPIPEEERVLRHDTVFWDMKNSYKKYKGIYYMTDGDDNV